MNAAVGPRNRRRCAGPTGGAGPGVRGTADGDGTAGVDE